MSIISFANDIGVPAGIASASFTLAFSLAPGIIRKVLEKRHKIVMPPKSKSNSIKTLISQALVDFEISHEEFKTIINEKGKYEKMEKIYIY